MKSSIKLSKEEKIDLIFNFIFNGKSHQKEEEFWNSLSETEAKELEKIKKEDVVSINELKSLIWSLFCTK